MWCICLFNEQYWYSASDYKFRNVEKEVSKHNLSSINRYLYRQKYYIINKFMQRKNLAKETQTSVKQYLDYLFESRNEGRAEEDAIIAMLSEGLQEKIKKEINGR